MHIQVTFETNRQFDVYMDALASACTFLEGYLATKTEGDSMVKFDELMAMRDVMASTAKQVSDE